MRLHIAVKGATPLFILISLTSQQAIEAIQLSWAFCENCLSDFCVLTCMDALVTRAQERKQGN